VVSRVDQGRTRARREKSEPEAEARPVDATSLVPPLPIHSVVAPDGTQIGDLPEVDAPTMVKMYRTMLLIRALDERMMILQRQGRVGFYGTCTGQEAVPIGTAAALAASDWIFPGLREGAAMLYRGYSLETYVCQIFGNARSSATTATS
jgi:pyruvate dehydrogenase E1 component alpha subunit